MPADTAPFRAGHGLQLPEVPSVSRLQLAAHLGLASALTRVTRPFWAWPSPPTAAGRPPWPGLGQLCRAALAPELLRGLAWLPGACRATRLFSLPIPAFTFCFHRCVSQGRSLLNALYTEFHRSLLLGEPYLQHSSAEDKEIIR